MEIRTPLLRVETFNRDAVFLARYFFLHAHDVRRPGPPLPVFTISSKVEINSGIAVSGDMRLAYFTDGATVWQLSPPDSIRAVATPGELAFVEPGIDLITYRLNLDWAVSREGNLLYSRLMPFDLSHAGRDLFVRMDLRRRIASTVDCGSIRYATAFDPDREWIYEADQSPAPGRASVTCRAFHGATLRRHDLRTAPWRISLSPDGSRLLICAWGDKPKQQLSVLDLQTGEERPLGCTANHAMMGPGDRVYFLEGENALWRFELDHPVPELVAEIESEPRPADVLGDAKL